MIHHEKCVHFTNEEKEKVRWAYNLAHDLHAKQDRSDNKPYIEHIDRSVKLYLNETLDSDEACNSQYLIALILHDSIEDNDNGLISIIEKSFDINIIIDVLWMSKPTKRVIHQVMKLEQSYPAIFDVLKTVWFIEMYRLINEHKPEKYVDQLKPDKRLSPNMCESLKQLWKWSYKRKYNFQKDSTHKHKVYAEYMFLCMIGGMPRELFRIKGTERRDNMQDIGGLLKPEKVRSAEWTMFTTMEVYVPRAREVWDHRLVQSLIQDRNNERAEFVKAKLLEPEITWI